MFNGAVTLFSLAGLSDDEDEDDEDDDAAGSNGSSRPFGWRVAAMVEKVRKDRKVKKEVVTKEKAMAKLLKREKKFKDKYKDPLWVGVFQISGIEVQAKGFDLELTEKRGGFTMRGFQGSMHDFQQAIGKGLIKFALKSGGVMDAIKGAVGAARAANVEARKERREKIVEKVSTAASGFKEAVVASHEKGVARRRQIKNKIGGKLKSLFGKESANPARSETSSPPVASAANSADVPLPTGRVVANL